MKKIFVLFIAALLAANVGYCGKRGGKAYTRGKVKKHSKSKHTFKGKKQPGKRINIRMETCKAKGDTPIKKALNFCIPKSELDSGCKAEEFPLLQEHLLETTQPHFNLIALLSKQYNLRAKELETQWGETEKISKGIIKDVENYILKNYALNQDQLEQLKSTFPGLFSQFVDFTKERTCIETHKLDNLDKETLNNLDEENYLKNLDLDFPERSKSNLKRAVKIIKEK